MNYCDNTYMLMLQIVWGKYSIVLVSLVAIADVIDLRKVIVNMSYKVLPPDLKESKSYEIFKKELQIWETTTPVPKDKQGAVIASGLPDDCRFKKDLKDIFFENVDVAKLAFKDGLELVKTFLEEQLGEDELDNQVRTWFEFEDFERENKEKDPVLVRIVVKSLCQTGARQTLVSCQPILLNLTGSQNYLGNQQ